MANYSMEKTIKAIENWFKDMRGDEEFLQGLFYDKESIGIHKKILNSIEFFDGEEFYFSRIPNGSLSKDKRYNLWCKKGKKEGEESTWTSDGYIICSSNGAEEDKGLVEFKGTYNINLRHNDLAKLIQYLYFCGCEKKYLLWFGQESMIEDIIWICGRFTEGKINNHFFEVCNYFNPDDYKNPKADSLSVLSNKIEKNPKGKQPKAKSVDSYDPVQFKVFLQDDKEHKNKVKKAIKDYLILINYDKCSVDYSRQVFKIIDLQKLCDDKDKESNFLEYINKAKEYRNQ